MPLNPTQWAFKEGQMSNLVNLQQEAGGRGQNITWFWLQMKPVFDFFFVAVDNTRVFPVILFFSPVWFSNSSNRKNQTGRTQKEKGDFPETADWLGSRQWKYRYRLGTLLLTCSPLR